MRPVAAFADEALGSALRLLVVAPPRAAEATWAAVRAEMAAVDAALSRHRADSQLTLLNRASPDCIPVAARLRHALALAWRAYRSSLGRFDPRILAAVEAAGDRAGVPLPPSPARLSSDERWLRVDRRGMGVLAPVDLGGIGKGLALRWSAERIRRLGVRDFLVEAGGDIVASGAAPGGGGWRVSLAAPHGRRPLAVLELPVAAVALATSAQTRRRHIIDPATLRPVDGPVRQATVAGMDPAWAEVRSKLALLGRAPDALERAWWYGADGRLRATASARAWTAWEALSPSPSSAAR